MTAFLTVVVPLLAAILVATVTLYSKRLDRHHKVEEQHAAGREAAYDRLLAAGDAAWFHRTQSAVDSNKGDGRIQSQ
jgi:hypothetical protein